MVPKDGAGDRSRTYDLRITNALLYQLSYTGTRQETNAPRDNRWRILRTDIGRCNCISQHLMSPHTKQARAQSDNFCHSLRQGTTLTTRKIVNHPSKNPGLHDKTPCKTSWHAFCIDYGNTS